MAGAAPTVKSMPKTSHGLIAERDNVLEKIPRSKIAARTTYFTLFSRRSAFCESLELRLVHLEKIRNTQSVREPNAHIHPQKKRPASIVNGSTAARGIRSGQISEKENVPEKIVPMSSKSPENAKIYREGIQTKNKIWSPVLAPDMTENLFFFFVLTGS